MVKKDLDLAVQIAEIKKDLEYIKIGIDTMHEKQNITNGRINKLESEKDCYLKKNDFDNYKEKISNATLDVKGKIYVGLIGAGGALLVVLAQYFLK